MAEIDALLYLPGHPKADLERALHIPALSPGWKGSLQSLLQQTDGGSAQGGNTGLTTAAASPPPAWAGLGPLQVINIHSESRDVFSLSLASSDGEALPSWLPGQSITLRLRGSDDHAPLIRSYSLSNRPGSETFRISVKQEPHGAAGEYLHNRVRLGDSLDVAAPRGAFFLTEGEGPVLLVSAGVGVTPVLSMLHALVQAQSPREVWWLHGARDGSEHSFATEARTLLDELPHSRSQITYSRPAPTDQQGIDYATSGRLSAGLINSLMVPRHADAYLCGPAAFMAELGAALRATALIRRAFIWRHLAQKDRSLRESRRCYPRSRRISRPDRPAKGLKCRLPAAALPPSGALSTQACWNSLKPATCRHAGPAGRASVTPAKQPCCPA